jgi:flagellar biosynthesis protein FlhB
MGIYSAHYYYKYANNGSMSYKQGIQVGMITVLFTSLVISLLTYTFLLVYGAHFMNALLLELKAGLQQLGTSDANNNFIKSFTELILTPKSLVMAIFFSITLTGFIFTLFITLFSRTKN